MNIDTQIKMLWAKYPKEFLEALEEYSEEIRMTPNLEEFSHRFNITRRLAQLIRKNKARSQS